MQEFIHLKVILPPTPGSSKWPFSLRFPHQNPVYTSRPFHTYYMPCPSHSSRFVYTNKYWVSSIDQYTTLHFPISCSDLRFVLVFFGVSCMLLQFYGMWSDVQLHDIISTGVRNPRAGRNKIISPCTNRKAEKKFCKLCMYSELV